MDEYQLSVAWSYFWGMLFFGIFLGLLIQHLETPLKNIGYFATLSLMCSQSIIIRGIHLAALRTAYVYEDYLGDEVPIPIFQDPKNGQWIIKSELTMNSGADSDGANSDSGSDVNSDRPCSLCLSVLHILSCCSPFLRFFGEEVMGQGNGRSGEDAPVLGPHPPSPASLYHHDQQVQVHCHESPLQQSQLQSQEPEEEIIQQSVRDDGSHVSNHQNTQRGQTNMMKPTTSSSRFSI